MMSKHRYIKLQYKIMIAFILGVIVPMFLISITTGAVYKKNLKDSTSEISRLLSAQIESNIDTYLNNISQISLYPYYDEWMQQQMRSITLDGNKDYLQDREANQRVSDFLFNMTIQNKYIRSVFLTDLEGNVIYSKSNGGAMQGELNFFQPYIKNMDKEFMLIPTHRQSYLKRSNLEVFSYVRVIKDVKTNTPIGYTVLEIKIDAIENLIQNMESSNEDYIAIYLEDGGLLRTNFQDTNLEKIFGKSYREGKEKGEKIPERTEAEGRKYLVSYSEMSSYGVTTVIYRDETTVFGALNRISHITLGLVLGILLLVLGNTYVFSKRLTLPLNNLVMAMREVETGNFKIRVVKRDEDEVGRLTDCFNTMLEKIDELIFREYKMELQEKETEIKALQNQINPHFLYNALESITMMAEINDDIEVAAMIADLGTFFRFVVSGTGNQVLLGSELEYVETYIRIQNIRFHNKIYLQVECPEELKSVKIIKLCIQPLVENCVVHGYKQGDQIKIEINICDREKRLIVSVRDYGKGAEESVLNELIHNLDQQETSTKSIGLKNVHQRLILTYGNDAGLKFENKADGGFHVWFEIPFAEPERDISE